MRTSRREAKFVYDVAFSYAEEDRDYVERVVRAVEGQIRISYDRHEPVDLWGKDLHRHLAEVYGEQSRLCVMFLSRHYADKVWTNHEREIAQARAYREHSTFILPARFDDTVIPQTLDAIAYLDLRSMTPEAFAELLVQKVRAVEAEADEARPRIARRWAFGALAAAAALALLLSGVMGRGAPQPGAVASAPARAQAPQEGPPITVASSKPASGRDVGVVADGSRSRVAIGGSVKSTAVRLSATQGAQIKIAGDVGTW